ncbi:MAG: response regulator [Labilithrix sp.]|nr:response regulator [Labilithrix sp.]
MSLARRIDPFLPLLRDVGAATAVISAGEGVCIFANEKLVDLYGDRMLEGHDVLATYPELRGAGLFDRVPEVLHSGEPFASPDLSILVASEEGSLVVGVFEVLITAIRDESGSIEGAIVFARDLEDASVDGDRALLLARERNARRIAEASARRLRRLQTTTAALAEAVTMAEIGDVVISNLVEAFNADQAELFACHEDERRLELIAARGIAEAHREERANLPLEADVEAARVCRNGEGLFVEKLPVISTSGAHALACIPLQQQRKIVGVLTMGFDAPRRFSSEDRAFFRSFGVLCGQALFRASLYDAERRAKEEALAASRVKDEFLATLSHELRTPLQAILGWARLLRAPVDPEVTAKAVQSIDRNARTQARLVADMLDATRVMSGRLHIDKRVVRVRDFVNQAIDTLRADAEAKDITIETTFHDRHETYFGDLVRLQQVVWNLVANAVKFTPRGGRVTVTVTFHDDLVIQVDDTGTGIPSDFLPFVFERFRQAKGGTTRQHGGLGLGLAIVRHIVELHGGMVSAESAGPGHGATFVARFPNSASSPSSSTEVFDPSTTDVSLYAHGTLDLEGIRALVVDDDDSARELVVAALERFGATVAAARSAEHALSMLGGFGPDIVVSDIGMPDVDGYELVRRIRALESPLASVPALALTAYAREVERQHALDAGFGAHLSKPIDPADLAAAVRGMVMGRSVKSAPPSSATALSVAPESGDA